MNAFFKSVKLMSVFVKQNGYSGIGTNGVSPYDIIKHYRKIKGYDGHLTKRQLRDWAVGYYNGKTIKPTTKTNINRFVHRIKVNKKGVLDGYAEDMRKKPTKAEETFKTWLDKYIDSDFCDVPEVCTYEWQKVFNKKGVKRIADFYFPNVNIIVEIDGGYHNTSEQRIEDEKRENELRENFNVRILRLTNDDILRWPEDCIGDIIVSLRRPSINQIKQMIKDMPIKDVCLLTGYSIKQLNVYGYCNPA